VTESMPPTPEDELQQLQRSLNEKVLDRAAGDPRWRQLLLDDPDATLREAGFPEFQRIEELRQREAEEAEVTGQLRTGQPLHSGDPCTCKSIYAYTDFYAW
jgi:hypothetical protein